MTTAAVVAAAGSGVRLGAGMPKALVRVGDRTLLELSVEVMLAAVDLVVVTAPPGLLDEFAALVPAARVVAGGETRQASVRAALAVIPPDVDAVLVHDAARALVPGDVVRRVLDALHAGAEAVIPVLPLADTVKEVDAAGSVVRTIDRSSLRAVQTPQGFRRTTLERAHEAAVSDVTDDAALVEALGVPVMTVEGSSEGLKVTTPADLDVAEAILAKRRTRV